MTPEHWRHVRDLLASALQLAVPERSEFLDRNCADDPSLRQELETLLAAEEELPSTFLGSESMVPAETAAMVIGRYHLLQKIGEGGMGEVWLAEQREPVRRRLALKLVKTGMKTRELSALRVRAPSSSSYGPSSHCHRVRCGFHASRHAVFRDGVRGRSADHHVLR